MQRPSFEKWNKSFSIDKIFHSLQEKIKLHPPVEAHPGYGGWSLLSADGKYDSGWNEKSVVFNPQGEMDELATIAKLKALHLPNSFSQTMKTVIYTSPVDDALEILKNDGFEVARVRLSFLKPGAHLYWHTDVHPSQYGVRFHIPLQTNQQSFFEFENEKLHLQADGAGYFIRINRKHRYSNQGSTIRYHLTMDIRDHNHRTEWFKYPLDI